MVGVAWAAGEGLETIRRGSRGCDAQHKVWMFRGTNENTHGKEGAVKASACRRGRMLVCGGMWPSLNDRKKEREEDGRRWGRGRGFKRGIDLISMDRQGTLEQKKDAAPHPRHPKRGAL